MLVFLTPHSFHHYIVSLNCQLLKQLGTSLYDCSEECVACLVDKSGSGKKECD